MRLIDGDKLIEELEGWYKHCGGTTNQRDLIIQDAISSAMDTVNEAETIDAEHVRLGFWKWGLGFPYCSECKMMAHEKGFVGYHTSDYCPNCGARMDGATNGV